jgi:hypothetical protein
MAALTPADDGCGPAALEWAWAGLPLEGLSGDLHVVEPFRGGVLVALIDGLGHGDEAAAAAQAAGRVLRERAAAPVQDLVGHCHVALRKTRGVVLTLVSFNLALSTMTWTGVGNVEAVLLRAPDGDGRDLADEAVLGRGGIVGYVLPPLRADTVRVGRGDLLVMTTDGIRSGYADDVERHGEPEAIASWILSSHGRQDDDAHVLVARFRGAGA